MKAKPASPNNSSPRQSLVAFAPDPARGGELYKVVKSRVVKSLREVAAASRQAVEFDDVRLAAVLAESIRAERVSSKLFASYYGLIDAADRDDLDMASAIFTQLAGLGCRCDRLSYRNFADDDLGPGNAELYGRLIDTEPQDPLNLWPIDEQEFERITGLANEALALLDAGAPEVAGEIRALVSEIVFAKGKPGSTTAFHGVSSFLLWGTLVINAEGHHTTLELLQTLAHESSHLHLFGVAVDEPLVLNPDEERHSSPLRRDPRPMDGIYHATYVTARMHYALTRVLESGELDAAQRQQAEFDLSSHAESFRKGLGTVEAHGRLTPLGSALLSNACEYMTGGISRKKAAHARG